MKTWTKLQIFTYIALFVLLAIRIPIADLVSSLEQLFGTSTHPIWGENLALIQDVTGYLYERWTFVLVGIVVILNQSDLKSLNIDEHFIVILLCNGIAYCLYYFWPSGWIAALISIYLFILSYRKEYKFVNIESALWRIVMIIVIGFFLGLLLISDILDVTKIRQAIHWSIVGMPFVVIEEVIFRGLLWASLKNLNLSEPKIVVWQAILFWFSYAYYMFTDPILFWVIIPIASILFGIFVWRSRSITPSTIAHILFNFLWWLIRT